jgi:phosphate transport system ATP-binding protein
LIVHGPFSISTFGVDTQGGRTGYLVEYGDTPQIFENPQEKHTQDYIRGEFS